MKKWEMVVEVEKKKTSIYKISVPVNSRYICFKIYSLFMGSLVSGQAYSEKNC